jgi:hypothetical protein
MNSRLRSVFYIFSIAGILICVSLFTLQIPSAHAQDPAPTPTYDPLAQPELPPNPTDLEMGRYLFWRHCMPCHGDIGQGLTDDFRALWEEHANCWSRGCHSGKQGDEGFPIPKVIPAIVTEDHLSQFTSEQELFEFLKATHPPQHPGYLENEEYREITLILFNMNNRSPDETVAKPRSLPSATSTPTPESTPAPVATRSSDEIAQPNTPLVITGLGIAAFAVVVYWVQKYRRKNR